MRLSVNVSDEMHEYLKVRAAQTKRTMRQIIIECIESMMKQEKEQR